MIQTLANTSKDIEVNTDFKLGRHSVYILLLCVQRGYIFINSIALGILLSYINIIYSPPGGGKGGAIWLEV